MRSRMPVRALLLTGLWWLGQMSLLAQLSDFQVFLQASLRRDYEEAFRLLGQQPDSALHGDTWLARPEMFWLDSLERSRTELSVPAMRGLLRAQAWLGQRSDSSWAWHRQAAETLLSFRAELGDSTLPVLTRALTHRPYELPRSYWQELAYALRSDTLVADWRPWLQSYAVLDYVLIQMPVIHPESVPRADRRRQELMAFLDRYGQDCEGLREQHRERVRMGFVSPREYGHLFLLVESGGCGYGSTEDTIRSRAAALNASPYLRLRAAESYLRQERFWEAQQVLAQAVASESDPRLKAALELRLAGMYAIRRSFRSANLHARQAAELHPGWGAPWLFLADLVETSGPICADSRQERLALTYLAMEYCEEAARREPQLSEVVASRLHFFRQQLPDPETLRFLGLQVGDRIPIACWINEVARVR